MGNKTNNGINLLKAEEKSFFERFLAWTLTVGRVLVIITEAIALGAFLYRFGLDMKLVDLKDQIKPLQAYIESKKDQEENFRDIQERLSLIKKHENEAADMDRLFQEVINNARGKIRFTNIDMGSDSIKIDAVTTSANLLSSFITSLKSFPDVKSISLDKVESTPASSEISVQISVNLQKNGVPTKK